MPETLNPTDHQPPPPDDSPVPNATKVADNADKNLPVVEERRESYDTGYSSLENGECKSEMQITISDVLKTIPLIKSESTIPNGPDNTNKSPIRDKQPIEQNDTDTCDIPLPKPREQNGPISHVSSNEKTLQIPGLGEPTTATNIFLIPTRGDKNNTNDTLNGDFPIPGLGEGNRPDIEMNNAVSLPPCDNSIASIVSCLEERNTNTIPGLGEPIDPRMRNTINIPILEQNDTDIGFSVTEQSDAEIGTPEAVTSPAMKPARGRPRKNAKKETAKNSKKSEKLDDKEKDSADEPRRSNRLKSKTENTVRMEDLLNSINISEIEKAIEVSRISNEGCDTVSSDSTTENATSNEATAMPRFRQILENEYCTERSISKDAERMICDCLLTREEILRGEKGCGEDCLNRLLLIECCSRCTLGDLCSNKRFQKREYARCEVFKTKKKGNGLRLLEDIPSGTFIMEYVGEVIDSDEFERRAMEYAKGKSPHFYFMSLKSDCIIDATERGNISRFINHSCEPNAETQKWTVQGELRIGFFSKRDINAGEEITFDYQLQRYGKQAQRCYCDTPSCTGWIGQDPDKQTSDEKKKEKKKKKEDGYQDLETALDELCQVGLINRHQTLSLNRLMVHAKELPVRMQILQLIEEGHPACRRLFVDYHGLPIIWSWMVDCTPDQDELKTQLLKTLSALPITNKTILIDSKVLPLVEQWAFAVDQKPHSEQLSAQSVLESVEDIASADETPVSEMAQKVLEEWSSLREMYRIPKKERIQQMKEHEREADQNIVKPRPKRVPLYVENMRERYHRNRHNRDKDFDKIFYDKMKDSNGTDRKRKASPERRSFDSRSQRKFETPSNKISKQEHRYMFEMKFREKEQQQQQQYWYQNQMYYNNAAMANVMSTGQYLTTIPPPNYTGENVYQNIPAVSATANTAMYQNIPSVTATPNTNVYQSLPPSTPNTNIYQTPTYQNIPSVSSTPTSTYYNTPPPNMYSNVVLPPTHIPPPSIQIPNASPQTYYQNQVHVPSYPPPTIYRTPEVKTTLTSPYECNAVNDIPALENTDGESQSPAPSTVSNSSIRNNAPVKEINPVNIDITKLKLPPKWKTARDSEGRLYYYHKETRVSQWYPPKWEEPEEEEEVEVTDEESSDDSSSEEEKEEVNELQESDDETNEQKPEEEKIEQEDQQPEAETAAINEQETNQDEIPVDIPTGIPLVTEHIISPREPIDEEERIRAKLRRRYLKEKMRRRKKQKMLKNGTLNGYSNGSRKKDHAVNGDDDQSLSVAADTSENMERKKKDSFRRHMANFIVTCLNPYFRSSCTHARITNDSDFKHLARKLTHFVMLKELKHCQNVSDLNCNASVKYKAKEYVKKYMSKFDEVYVRPLDDINY